jgi:hypothetical protein
MMCRLLVLVIGLLLVGCVTCETPPTEKPPVRYPCKCEATIQHYYYLWYCDCPTMTCLVRDSARPACLPKPLPVAVPR